MKVKLLNAELDQEIVFWKWISSRKLGLVTKKEVYSLDLDDPTTAPRKLFERYEDYANTHQITNLIMDRAEEWYAVTALTLDGGQIVGKLQLVRSREDGPISQMLNGSCICFAEVFLHDLETKSKILAFYEFSSSTKERKIHLLEYEMSSITHSKFKTVIGVPTNDNDANDIPVYMQISPKYAMLYVIMKSGGYMVYEIKSGKLMGQGRLSDSVVFIGAKDTRTDGVLVLNKKGVLIGLEVDQERALM